MKSKYKILLSLIVVFIGYILYSNKKIDGVWVAVYNLPQETQYSFYSSNGNVLEIKNGKVKLHSFYEDVVVENFLLLNNHFYFSKIFSGSKIQIYNKDSMVISYNSYQDNTTKVYKKINNKYRSKSKIKEKLINKMFRLDMGKIIDTIYFSEHNLLFKNPKNSKKYWEATNYSITNINDFAILQTQFSAMILKESKENPFIFRPENKKEFTEIKLTEIQGDLYHLNKTLEVIEIRMQKIKSEAESANQNAKQNE